MAKTYKYIGGSMGVPGLPHVITDAEAEAQGILPLLQDAISNGSYEEVNDIAGVDTRGKNVRTPRLAVEKEVTNG